MRCFLIIEIEGGHQVVLDDDMAHLVEGRKWKLRLTKAGDPGHVITRGLKRHAYIALHRLVIGAKPGQIVDHVSGDVLDNRRANLRVCTHAENMRNRRMQRNNRCGFKGVYPQKNSFRAQIRANGVKYLLGSFATPERAHQAYVEAAKRLHGDFARFA